MSALILHHFELSPFAEKVRLIMGLKGLTWSSVQIPMIMPKPDLMPLTGGYRKTPVLQVGADVYCDTRRIAVELERRFPEPSLYPDGGEGLARALAAWSDRAFFEPGAGLSMALNEAIPKPLLDDRKAFFNFMDFDRLADSVPHLIGQLVAHAELIECQLGDGREYLSGTRPGLTDVNAWFVVWMSRSNLAASARWFAPFERMAAWERRIAVVGHGRRSDIDAAEALDMARAATPSDGGGVTADDPSGLSAGEPVTVTPDDYGRVSVAGTLVTLQRQEIAVRRSDARVGEVVVHFPRIGYRVERQIGRAA